MNLDKLMEGITKFLLSLKNEQEYRLSRQAALTTNIKGVIIDTVFALDTELFETGIKISKNHWIIVKQYPDKQEAIKGHKKYVNQVRKGEKKFKDIDLWGIKE